MITKTEAKAAVADLLELCKNAPEEERKEAFDTLMQFINQAPAPGDTK